MRLFINILALFGLAIGITSTFNLYGLRISADGPQGFANVTVPLWALVGSVMAIIFGFIGRIIDRRAPRPASKLSDAAIVLGFLCGALVLAVPFVFG